MLQVRLLQDKNECEWGVRINEGIIPVIKNGKFVLNWESKFTIDGDLLTLYIYPEPAPENATCLNQLNKENKIIEETHCYDEYDIDLGYPDELSDDDIIRIAQEFKEHGFNVTENAIWHNYTAWLVDAKSGYRDEANGYHLFSPCGCNPLSFRVTSLDKRLDWQETYVC